MVDVDPDELKYCACDFPALFSVIPKNIAPQRDGRHGSATLLFQVNIETPRLPGMQSAI